jgi:hypothetical protein
VYAGAVSIVPNAPSRDLALITAEAMLAARETAHPDA